MISLNRWQYPWVLLSVITFGLTIAGYYFTGISITTVYPTIVGIGLLIIVVQPKSFGYVMSGFGILSLIIAGVLMFKDTSHIVQISLIAVGIGALVGGIQSHKKR